MNRAASVSFGFALTLLPLACAPREAALVAPLASVAAPSASASAAVPTTTLPPLRVADGSPEESFAPGDRSARLRGLEAELRALVQAEAKRADTPALAVGVILDGQLAFTAFQGFADPATERPLDERSVFRIGSITKTFTASAIVKLRDEGKLSLDEPVTRFLPELAQLRYPTTDSRPITLRHLLTHTSGLPRLGHFDYVAPDHDPTEAEVLASGDVALANVPGTRNVYSNLGLSFAGLVVGRVAGSSLRAYLGSQILAPLGLRATVWSEADVPVERRVVGFAGRGKERKPAPPWRLGASEGSGGLYSSLADMSRWIAFQLDAYPPRGGDDEGPLARASRRELHAPQALGELGVYPASGELGQDLVDVYQESVGLAFWNETSCFAEGIVKHAGAVDGFQSSIMFAPKRGFGVVVLSSNFEEHTDPLARRMVRLLATRGFDERQRRGPVSPALRRGLEALLALQNGVGRAWDEAAYRAAITERHAKLVTPDAERRELAGYHGRHGVCRVAEPMRVDALHAAVFELPCERGRLQLRLQVDPDGRIAGFGGESSGIAPSPSQLRAAEHVAALFTKFDERRFRAHLLKAFPDVSERRAWFERKRDRYGACRLGRSLDRQDEQGHASFLLSCERGSDLQLSVRPADENGDQVASFHVRSAQEGLCPPPATGLGPAKTSPAVRPWSPVRRLYVSG